MAHVMKLTKAAVGHMCKHWERAKDEKGEYIKFGNQEIDPDRTHLNYNLAPDQSQGGKIKNRCSEVYCLNRKDVNVACSWVVTLPKDYASLNGDRSERDFFSGTYQFLSDRYGKENIVSAYVHNDESQPHLHFCFVPVVHDLKKERMKVSAKECVNKYDLQTFHENLGEYLQEQYGLHCNVLNDATKDGNRSIEELKRGTATENLYLVEKEVENMKKDISILFGVKKSLEGKIEALEGHIMTFQEVSSINIKKPLIGGENGMVKVSYKDLVDLQSTAKKVSNVENILQQVTLKEKEISQAQENLSKKREEIQKLPLKQQIKLDKLLQRAEKAEKKADKVLADVNKALEKCPKNVSDTFIQAYKEVGIKQKKQSLLKNKGFGIEQ